MTGHARLAGKRALVTGGAVQRISRRGANAERTLKPPQLQGVNFQKSLTLPSR